MRRWYCAGCHRTFSALPDCLACGVSGTLEEIEEIAALAEASGKMAAVRFFFASDVDPLVPWRLVRRRCGWMDGLLGMLCGLLPLFFGMEPTLWGLRARLGSRTRCGTFGSTVRTISGRWSIRLDSGCRGGGGVHRGGRQQGMAMVPGGVGG